MTDYYSTTEYTFVPPDNLVEKWYAIADEKREDVIKGVALRAAQWGADQEIKACCEYISGEGKWFANPEYRLQELQSSRRPKPPSLKEQALKSLTKIEENTGATYLDASIIRDALNSLPD